ncbi:glycosyltransferase [Microbacterium excoecariae]|uniref:glycosyltransferase n=1 Tax=Microbacterium excoecariae TaxID=2715210 RepID=UPI00140A01BE|nr:glycosyltransferase [Microbacterium excoecariae]NHI18002.1 glycosyltransferase [Microbacterium excoecariae]
MQQLLAANMNAQSARHHERTKCTLNFNQSFRNKKALLVASTGGHLAQLQRMADQFRVSEDSLWVTFKSNQSESLLAGRRVSYVDYIRPRGLRQVLRATISINKILAREDFDAVVSTGAGIALASHVNSSMRRIPTTYIESVSRVNGPSVTGRILERVPGVRRVAQHSWGETRRGWSNEYSILETFEPHRSEGAAKRPRRIFVTLGTIQPYEFRELVEVLDAILPHDVEIVWQLGVTPKISARGRLVDYMTSEEFDYAVDWADLVVSHAGVGTLIALIERGKEVIAVPRRAHRGEHVDDHQLEIATEFSRRDLLTMLDTAEIGSYIEKRFADVSH